MGVIALMKCNGISTREGNYKSKLVVAGRVELSCFYTDNEAMREYADASPDGKLELSIENPEALTQFQPGKYYTIKIEETKIE